MKKYKIILVNEKKTNIKYPGVDKKGLRPYLIVKENISQGYILVCPFTSKYDFNNKKKKSYNFWIDFIDEKESYIKLDHLYLLKKVDEGKTYFLKKEIKKKEKNMEIYEMLKKLF